MIHSLKEGLARERARDSGGSDRVVLGGDESDVPRLGRLAVPDEQPEQRAPVASGLVLHLLAECLVLDGTKQDAAELGILLLDDERLVDEAGRDGFHREGVEVMRGVEAGVRRDRVVHLDRERRLEREGNQLDAGSVGVR